MHEQRPKPEQRRPKPEIIDLIQRAMGGWDGLSPDAVTRRGNGLAWAEEMYRWGRRVRRDILVIEHHLKAQHRLTDADFYGDPGDPPPPPESF